MDENEIKKELKHLWANRNSLKATKLKLEHKMKVISLTPLEELQYQKVLVDFNDYELKIKELTVLLPPKVKIKKEIKILTGESIMPNGKYSGKKMSEVPSDYLVWCYENNYCNPSVKKYVEDNLETLKKKNVEKFIAQHLNPRKFRIIE